MKKFLFLVALFCAFKCTASSQRHFTVLVFANFRNGMNLTAELAGYGIEISKREHAKEASNIDFKVIDIDDNMKTAADQVARAIRDFSPDLMIGAIRSDHAFVISDLAEQKKIPFITPLATHPSLTKNKTYTFRTCLDDEQQAEYLSEFIFKEKKLKTVTLITHQEMSFSLGFSKAFRKSYETMGGRIIDEIKVRRVSDLTNEKLFEIRKNQPDAFVIPLYQVEAAGVISLLAPISKKSVFIGPDSWGGGDLFRKVFTRGTSFKGYYAEHWSEASKTLENKNFYLSLSKNGKDFKLLRNTHDNSLLATVAAFYELTNIAIHVLSMEPDLPILHKIEGLKFVGTRGKLDFTSSHTPVKSIYIYEIEPNSERFYGKYPK